MPDSVARTLINSLMPDGAIWQPKSGADLDLLLDGIGDNAEIMRQFMASLALLRDPMLTDVLRDLEMEFGVDYNPTMSDAERRAALFAAKTARQGNGTDTFMQAKLIEGGFDLQVHVNDPPVNPNIIMAAGYHTYLDHQYAYMGHEDAICGRAAGELLVNALDSDSNLSTPTGSDYWPGMFFVGGDATRNPSTNELEYVDTASVPVARADELRRLIVKYKSLNAWCGLIIVYT